jgi:chromosome segregation ATPase
MAEDVEPSEFIANLDEALKNVETLDAAARVFDAMRARSVGIDSTLEAELRSIISAYERNVELFQEYGTRQKTLQPKNKDMAEKNNETRRSLGLIRDRARQNEHASLRIVEKRSIDGFHFGNWSAWKKTKAIASALATFFADVEKLIVETAAQKEVSQIDMEIARSERLKRFIGEAERAEVRLKEVLSSISTLGEKSKALEQTAEAWQEKINQAERVVERLGQRIPGSRLEEGGPDLTIYQILSNVDALTADFKAHESELTTLKSDWTALEKQAKQAEKTIADVKRVQGVITPESIEAQKKKISDALAQLRPVEEAANALGTRVAIVKKTADEAEKNYQKATTNLSTLEERLKTLTNLTPTESAITQAALQVDNLLARKLPIYKPGHDGDEAFLMSVNDMLGMASEYKKRAAELRPTMDQLKDDWAALEKSAEANEKIAAKAAAQIVRFDDEFFASHKETYNRSQTEFLQAKKKFDRLELATADIDKNLKAAQKTIDNVARLESGIAAAQARLDASADDRQKKFEAVREKQRALDIELRTEQARRVEVQATLSAHDNAMRALNTDVTRQRENLRLARAELDSIERANTALDKDYNTALARTQKLDDAAKALERKAVKSVDAQNAAAAKIDTVSTLSSTNTARASEKAAQIETNANAINRLVVRAKESHTDALTKEAELARLETSVKTLETRAKTADRSISSSVARITAHITNKAQSSKQLDSLLTHVEKIQGLLQEYLTKLRVLEPGGVPPAPPKFKATGGVTVRDVVSLADFPPIDVVAQQPQSTTTVAFVSGGGQPPTSTEPSIKTKPTATGGQEMALDEQSEVILTNMMKEVKLMGGYAGLRNDASALLKDFSRLVELLSSTPAGSAAVAISSTAKQPTFERIVADLAADAERFDNIIKRMNELSSAIEDANTNVADLRTGVADLQTATEMAKSEVAEYIGDGQQEGSAKAALREAKELQSKIDALSREVQAALRVDNPAVGGGAQEPTTAMRIASLEADVATLQSGVTRLNTQQASTGGLLRALTSETDRLAATTRTRNDELGVLQNSSAQLEAALVERRNALINATTQLYAVQPDDSVGIRVPVEEFQNMLRDLDRSKKLVLDLAKRSGWLLPPAELEIVDAPINYGFVERDAERQRVRKEAEAASAQRIAAETDRVWEALKKQAEGVDAETLQATQDAEKRVRDGENALKAAGLTESTAIIKQLYEQYDKLADDERKKGDDDDSRSIVPSLAFDIIRRRKRKLAADQAEREEAAKRARLREQQQQQQQQQQQEQHQGEEEEISREERSDPSKRGRKPSTTTATTSKTLIPSTTSSLPGAFVIPPVVPRVIQTTTTTAPTTSSTSSTSSTEGKPPSTSSTTSSTAKKRAVDDDEKKSSISIATTELEATEREITNLEQIIAKQKEKKTKGAAEQKGLEELESRLEKAKTRKEEIKTKNLQEAAVDL